PHTLRGTAVRVRVEPHRVDVRDRFVGPRGGNPMTLPHVLRTMPPVYPVHNYKATTAPAARSLTSRTRHACGRPSVPRPRARLSPHGGTRPQNVRAVISGAEPSGRPLRGSARQQQ